MKVGNFKKESPGEVFNSTSLPSGNLVDGLPLDLHSYRACAYLCTCLPCDPAGKINSLYNEEVYHSRCSFKRMNEMCVKIKHRAV